MKKPETFLRRTTGLACVFMGLGHLAMLRDWVRGAFYALVELLTLYFLLFEGLVLTGNGPLARCVRGLITLGDPMPDVPVMKRDHSIFMMIDGLIAVVILCLVVFLYVRSVLSARNEAKRLLREGASRQERGLLREVSDKAFPAVGLTPAVLLISFFVLVPLLFSALIAFTNYSAPNHIPPNNTVDWVGFENFHTLFNSDQVQWSSAFTRVAVWTVVWAALATVTCYAGGMGMALLTSNRTMKIIKWFRPIFILPYAIPGMITNLVWANLLNGQFGPINRLLLQLGIIQDQIPWLTDAATAKITLLLVNLWTGFPYQMMLITGVMTAISSDLYEAATIDGASAWQRFRKITLPMVLYQTAPLMIMSFTFNLNNFGMVFFLTGGGPNITDTTQTSAGATDLLVSWIYKLTMNTPQRYSYASVLAILIFAVVAPISLWNLKRTKAYKED